MFTNSNIIIPINVCFVELARPHIPNVIHNPAKIQNTAANEDVVYKKANAIFAIIPITVNTLLAVFI